MRRQMSLPSGSGWWQQAFSAQQGEILQRYRAQWQHWSGLDVLCARQQKAKDPMENSSHISMAFPKTAIIVQEMGSDEREQDFWEIKKIRCQSRKWRKPKAEQERGWMKWSCGAQVNILKLTTYSKILSPTLHTAMVYSPLHTPDLLLNP